MHCSVLVPLAVGSMFDRVLLFRFFFASISLYFCCSCLLKYTKRETGTRVNLVPTEAAGDFPSLTLCWHIGYKKSVVTGYGFEKQSQFLDFGKFPSNITIVSSFYTIVRTYII